MKYHVIYMVRGIFGQNEFTSRVEAKQFVLDEGLNDYVIIHGNQSA